MDDFAAAHPDYSPVRLKAAMYGIIAERFEPVLFKNSPFYSETGLNVGECDGAPWHSAAGWLLRRNYHLFKDVEPGEYERYLAADYYGIHLTCGTYPDIDHHCCSFSYILKHGLGYIFAQAEEARKKCQTSEETEFVEAAMTGLQAVRKMADKFAAAAEKADRAKAAIRNNAGSWPWPQRTARKIPWQPAETFYEAALFALVHARNRRRPWMASEFMCWAISTGCWVNSYRRDLAAGRITYDEAYDLLCRYMVLYRLQNRS